jgi:hypothetical protein
MKIARFVWIFWLMSLVLLVAVAAFLWHEGSGAQAERDTRNAEVANIETDEPRIEWKPDVEKPVFTVVDTRLSPIERPKPAPVIVPPPPKVEIEKTDDQLRDELATALNKRFKLLRMMLSSTDEYPDIALVSADGVRLQWFEDMNLKNEYTKAPSPALRKLAYDLVVLAIDDEGVLVDAASLEKPEKRFEILLEISQEPIMFSGQFLPDGKALRPIDPDDKKDADKPKTPAPDQREREDEFNADDFKDEAIDDFAKYTRATENGIEILKELPKDSPARKYGAEGGEIIKSINGEAVKSMSDVRRVVRTQYDAGTREFIVGYERDGVPGERTFSAPAKK